MKYNYLIKILMLCFVSCAQVTGINLQKHQFSSKPSKIIWIQVAGLHEEHFSWIHFDPEEKVNSFDSFLCFGKAWNYTLKDLRHNSKVGLRVQDTGKMNIKGECSDFKYRPIWSYLKEKGFSSGVLEIGADEKSSLVQAEKCDQDNYLKGAHVWVSRDNLAKNDRSFHADLKEDFKPDRIYFDKSCFQGKCASNRIQNIERLYTWLRGKSDKHLLIVKEYGFENALKNRNYQEAKKILKDLNIIAEAFLTRSMNNNTLFMMTGTSPIGIEIPDQGIKLKEFLEKGMNAKYRQSLMMSPVLANGARAENFCGIYKEVDMIKRIFSEPTESDKKYIFINPFESF